MKESDRALAERMQGKIIGELEWMKKAYLGFEPLSTHLELIEGYADVALGCLAIDEPSEDMDKRV